jgi:hypothetical protein
MAGMDLRTVAELLGHRTLQMVLRYSHLAPEHQAFCSRWPGEEHKSEGHQNGPREFEGKNEQKRQASKCKIQMILTSGEVAEPG